ncbi:MAG TPA: DUF805 domain-containing protein [Croceibacterium sp.]
MLASLPARLFSLSGRLNVPEAFLLQMLVTGLGSALVFALSQGVDFRREVEVRLAIDALVGLGMFFLLTKRLHDHGWSGWWALLGLPLIPLDAYKSWRVTLLNPEVLTGQNPSWYMPATLLSMPLIVALLGVFLIPGGSQENRYGPSPRRARNALLTTPDT